MEIKVGHFYYYEGVVCEVLNIVTDKSIDFDQNILIGLKYNTVYEGVDKKDLSTRMVWEYHKGCDLKDYELFSYFPKNSGMNYLTPAYKAVKDTKLARKMYSDHIYKEEDGFIYVRF